MMKYLRKKKRKNCQELCHFLWYVVFFYHSFHSEHLIPSLLCLFPFILLSLLLLHVFLILLFFSYGFCSTSLFFLLSFSVLTFLFISFFSLYLLYLCRSNYFFFFSLSLLFPFLLYPQARRGLSFFGSFFSFLIHSFIIFLLLSLF